MNCFYRCVCAVKKKIIIEFQVIQGIFLFRRTSLFGDSSIDISPLIAWRFWRKFLARGSTGNGAALGRSMISEVTAVNLAAAAVSPRRRLARP